MARTKVIKGEDKSENVRERVQCQKGGGKGYVPCLGLGLSPREWETAEGRGLKATIISVFVYGSLGLRGSLVREVRSEILRDMKVKRRR